VIYAALACFQRIDAGAHYLSDVLAGVAIACAMTALTQRLAGRSLTSEATLAVTAPP
jgi:membrane-associated phospholipid phosphatase